MTDNIGQDIMLERINEFKVGRRKFRIYPPSLGLTMMLKGAVERLGATDTADPLAAAAELAATKPLECCRVVSLAVCCTKDDAMDAEGSERRAKWLAENLDAEAIASLLIVVISGNKVERFLTESGIRAEGDRMRQVLAKKKGGTLVFGGKTIFGQLIDPAMERYGWTYDYTVWGISYAALTALMADKVNSVYLSEEERKQVPVRLLERDSIKGDDPNNQDLIHSMSWK